MNDQCISQEQKLKGLFGTWPACAKSVIADGKPWTIIDVDRAPDNMLKGSTITFGQLCEDKNATAIVKPTFNASSCSAEAGLTSQLTTAWGAIELKYCSEYNALTGKLNIPDDAGHEHPHTVTIRISGASSVSNDDHVIVCEYDDDVWNHSGSWKAQH